MKTHDPFACAFGWDGVEKAKVSPSSSTHTSVFLDQSRDNKMRRSIEYNNAGVACTEAGYHKVAWELFKGALELRLAMERGDKSMNDITHDEDVLTAFRDNAYIQRAEDHFRNITKYVRTIPSSSSLSRKPMDSGDSGRVNASFTYNTTQPQNSNQSPFQIDLMDDIYSPFLFRRPMRLSPDDDVPTRKESATVIFNLALVDHIKNRCSEQAVQLYELAMTLLTGDVVDELGIALMNNIGVWCYENGDMDGTMTCMGHLSTFLGSCGSAVNQEQRDGLQANILWLSHPPFAASPAA